MKLQSLWNHTKNAWQSVNDATQKFAHDHLSAYAAQSTFYLMLSFFPFVMLVCMATRLLPINEDSLLTLAQMILPESYREIGVDLIDGYYNENISSAKFFLIIFLIWTASRLIQALMNGFNSAYGIRENRSQTILRLIGCLYTILLCALMIVLVLMYVLGSKVMLLLRNVIPDQNLLNMSVNIVKYWAGPLMMLGIFWLSYVILPSRKTKFRDELPGAFMTALFWRGAISLMSVFLSKSMQHYSYVYGSLTNLIMMLVWLYSCVYCWFVGAELNWLLKTRKEKKQQKQETES